MLTMLFPILLQLKISRNVWLFVSQSEALIYGVLTRLTPNTSG